MDKEVQGAIEVQYALQFAHEVMEVHAIQHTVEDKHLQQLSQTMKRMGLQLEKLEGQMKAPSKPPTGAHGHATIATVDDLACSIRRRVDSDS